MESKRVTLVAGSVLGTAVLAALLAGDRGGGLSSLPPPSPVRVPTGGEPAPASSDVALVRTAAQVVGPPAVRPTKAPREVPYRDRGPDVASFAEVRSDGVVRLPGCDLPTPGAVEDDPAAVAAAREAGLARIDSALGGRRRRPEGLVSGRARGASLARKTAPGGGQVATVGTEVVATSHRHVARFGATGMQFLPKDARGEARGQAGLQYALEAVERGGLGLSLDRAVAPVASGSQVTFVRSPDLMEHYVAYPDGVEQLFAFAAIPTGSGDLVIRGAVSTDLEGASTPSGGVSFVASDAASMVSFGKARACDGLGRTVDCELALVGSALELRVPGAWLAGAQAPLLVDPLVDADLQLTDFAGDDYAPCVAYDAVHDEFVVAFTSGNASVVLSRLDGMGRAIGDAVVLDDNFGSSFGDVSIAWSEAGVENYLVAYSRDSTVWVAVVNHELGVVSAPARLHDPAGAGETQASSSVAYDPSRNMWAVVWVDSSSSASHDVLIERVDEDGTQQGYAVFRDLAAYFTEASISYSVTTDVYLVAYTDLTNGDVLGTVRSGDLTTTVSNFTISAGMNHYMPDTCWNAATNEFWVALFSLDTGVDVLARRVTVAGATTGSVITVAGSAFQPSVEYLEGPDKVLVTYYTSAIIGDIYAREYSGTGTAVGPGVEVTTASNNTCGYVPQLAANTTREEWLLVYPDERGATDYDLYTRRHASDSVVPNVLRFEPQDDASGILLDRRYAVVTFTHDMDASTITTSNLKLYEGVTPITTYSLYWIPQTRQALLTLSGDWPMTSSIRVWVSSAVESWNDVAMGTNREATFTTGAVMTMPDSDGDGLLDAEEALLGTDPYWYDTDFDSVSDYDEIYVYFTDPFNYDTDGDFTDDYYDSDPRGSAGDLPSVPFHEGLAATFEVTNITPAGTLGSPAQVTADTRIVVTFNNAVNKYTFTDGVNILLEDQTSMSNVSMNLAYAGPEQSIVLEPASPLTPGRTYELTVVGGGSSVVDQSGTNLTSSYTSAFTVSAPANEPFEAPNYSDTLARTGWEVFPIMAATASGRAGGAYVVPSTRKLCLSETDVTTPGRGIDVALTRTYRNDDASAVPGMFGKNWHFTYDRSFQAIADTNSDTYRELQHTTGDGRIYTYLSNGSATAASHVSPPAFYDTLRVVTISSKKLLVQRTRHGVEYFYEFHQTGNTAVEDPDALPLGAVGYLVRIRDANHNLVVINRAAANHSTRPMRIESIDDDLDRRTLFTYSTTSGLEDLCIEIEQFDGSPTTRSWLYSYDFNECLYSVETPETDWADDYLSINYSTRKFRYYSYSAGGVGWNLESIDDGRWNTSFRAFYDSNDDVTQIDVGAGYGSGTAVYGWRRLSGVFEATQIDRNGNVLVLEHDDAAVAPYWTITSARVYTRGLHPNVSGGEPASYLTSFTHDSDGELVEEVRPNGAVSRWIRDAKGNVLQAIQKAATAGELVSNGASYKREEDVVVECAYEPKFNRLIRMTEPRGNNVDFVGTTTTIVSTNESVSSQTVRTFNASNVDEEKRNAYTKFLYYDHENIGTRLTADGSAIGDTVALVRQVPKSYGRTAANATRDPPDSAFNDTDSDGFPDRGGNLLVVRDARPYGVNRDTGLLGGSRQVIEYAYTYNQWGQPLLEILPDGDTHRREYHLGSFNLTTNAKRGYLKLNVRDTEFTDADLDLSEGDVSGGPSGTGLELATQFNDYDVFGNALSTTSPRGVTWTREVNALNLVTRTIASPPFEEHTVDYLYDGNNNLVQQAVANVVANDTNDDGIEQDGEQLVVAAHPTFEHVFQYNSANRLFRTDLDAYGSDPATVVTTYDYDRKQLQLAVRQHDGNTTVTRYDERDRPYEVVRGSNDTSQAQTTRFDYSLNGHLAQVIDDDGNSNPSMIMTYDVFDRQTRAEDERGNALNRRFDVSGLPRQEYVTGLRTGAALESPTSNLSNAFFDYDELGRCFQKTDELFNAHATLASLGVSQLTPIVNHVSQFLEGGEPVVSLFSFGACSCMKGCLLDNGAKYKFDQDGLDRHIRTTDAYGSMRELAYDRDGNVIRRTDTELTTDGFVTEVYYQESYFDAKSRVLATVAHLGNTSRFLYDSRDNVVQTSDAMGPDTGLDLLDLDLLEEHLPFPQVSAGTTPTATVSINDRGNTTRFSYDGLSRPLSTTRDMRVNGLGDGQLLSGQSIMTLQTWDGNGRLTSQTDPNGNMTIYGYDALDRRILTQFADGVTRERQVYNRDGTLFSHLDARGVQTTYTYNEAAQRIAAAFGNVPPGQEQTTFQAWRYDGLGNMTRAEDNDTICSFEYDSLSRQITDEQSVATGAARSSSAGGLSSAVTGEVQRVFDGASRLIHQIYPDSTTLLRSHDLNGRLTEVESGGNSIATFGHIGLGDRRVSRAYDVPNVTAHYAYDGNRRLTRLDQRINGSNQRIRGFAYAFDRVGNRRFERRLTVNTTANEAGGPGEFYRYDSAYRLVHDDRDVSSGDLNVVAAQDNELSVTSPTPVSNASSDYALDLASNRRNTVIDGTTTIYDMRSNVNEFDFNMNQYTRVGSSARTHDANGNLLSSSELGQQRFFDAQDRMTQWTDATKDVRYRYDVLGRRVSKRMAAGGSTSVVYFWDGWQTVEETNTSGVVQKRYVWGEGIDEILKATLPDAADIDGDTITAEQVDLYYHHNSLGSVVAVTDAAGTVKESYRYSAFGTPSIYNAAGSVISTTAVKQPFLFTGARWDFEEASGLYQMRHRFYDPIVGRFVSRDPLGLWGDPSQNGNGQGYCGHNPVNRVDPLGEQDSPTGGGDPVADTKHILDKSESARDLLKVLLDDGWRIIYSGDEGKGTYTLGPRKVDGKETGKVIVIDKALKDGPNSLVHIAIALAHEAQHALAHEGVPEVPPDAADFKTYEEFEAALLKFYLDDEMLSVWFAFEVVDEIRKCEGGVDLTGFLPHSDILLDGNLTDDEKRKRLREKIKDDVVQGESYEARFKRWAKAAWEARK